MDDNFIVNRILDIVNSGSSNLILGNISNPRPGNICQVSTDYGIKSVYNINCTYPGEAIVVWDKDESQYYCFTGKPNTVLNKKQIGYRKYKQINVEKEQGKGYMLLFDSISLILTPAVNYNENTYTCLRAGLYKLNPDNKKLYAGIGDDDNKFLGMPINKSLEAYYTANYLYPDLNFIPVKDTELDSIEGILWLPLIRPNFTPMSTNNLRKIKILAKKYGVVLQSELNIWNKLSDYYLNTFYNPYMSPNLIASAKNNSTAAFNNVPPNKGVSIGTEESGGVDISLVKDKNIIAYLNNSLASIIYWSPSSYK